LPGPDGMLSGHKPDSGSRDSLFAPNPLNPWNHNKHTFERTYYAHDFRQCLIVLVPNSSEAVTSWNCASNYISSILPVSYHHLDSHAYLNCWVISWLCNFLLLPISCPTIKFLCPSWSTLMIRSQSKLTIHYPLRYQTRSPASTRVTS
jgi:hypothetical protein